MRFGWFVLFIFSQALVNLADEDTENLFLHFVVRKKQREEVLILRKSLDQCVVDTVEIRKRKVAFRVRLRTLAQFFGLHHQVFDLKHCLDYDVVIVGFARFAVDFVDNLRKAFYFVLVQIKVVRRRQFYDRKTADGGRL